MYYSKCSVEQTLKMFNLGSFFIISYKVMFICSRELNNLWFIDYLFYSRHDAMCMDYPIYYH